MRELMDYDDIWTVNCGVEYLKYVGMAFEEITNFDNVFYYESFLNTKTYLYINFDTETIIETDDSDTIKQYVKNIDCELFTKTEIYSNKRYINVPIKMLYETYKIHLIAIKLHLITFYSWANVAIVKFSKLNDNINFNNIIIRTKLNPFIFSGFYELLPMKIYFENKIYDIFIKENTDKIKIKEQQLTNY